MKLLIFPPKINIYFVSFWRDILMTDQLKFTYFAYVQLAFWYDILAWSGASGSVLDSVEDRQKIVDKNFPSLGLGVELF